MAIFEGHSKSAPVSFTTWEPFSALLSPSVLDSLDAAELEAAARSLSAKERQVAAAKMHLARRAEAQGSLARAGWRDAASFFSAISGAPKGSGVAAVKAAEAIEASPAAAQAFERGELSVDQATEVAKVAGQDEAAVGELLALAQDERVTHDELRQGADRAAQRLRSQDDEAERDRRLHARRSLRLRPDADGVYLTGFLPTLMGAQVKAALDARAEQFFSTGRATGQRQTRDQYLADALVSLVTGAQRQGGDAEPAVTIHVNAESLARGSITDGEVCEVPGVGPISVAQARALLGSGVYVALMERGEDIVRMSSPTRVVPRAVDRALKARDPQCVVPGCNMTVGLQRHHWPEDFSLSQTTSLEVLCMVCSRHHHALSARAMRLIGGPGNWQYVAETRYPTRPQPAGSGPTSAKVRRPAAYGSGRRRPVATRSTTVVRD